MKIDYIIPTLYRDTLDRAVASIKQEATDHNILICGEIKDGRGVGNRNDGLNKIRIDSDWIIFLDDDDYLMIGSYQTTNYYFLGYISQFRIRLEVAAWTGSTFDLDTRPVPAGYVGDTGTIPAQEVWDDAGHED